MKKPKIDWKAIDQIGTDKETKEDKKRIQEIRT